MHIWSVRSNLFYFIKNLDNLVTGFMNPFVGYNLLPFIFFHLFNKISNVVEINENLKL